MLAAFVGFRRRRRGRRGGRRAATFRLAAKRADPNERHQLHTVTHVFQTSIHAIDTCFPRQSRCDLLLSHVTIVANCYDRGSASPNAERASQQMIAHGLSPIPRHGHPNVAILGRIASAHEQRALPRLSVELSYVSGVDQPVAVHT